MGEAMDVPAFEPIPFPGTVDGIIAPGAKSIPSYVLSRCEKEAIRSAPVVKSIDPPPV